MKVRFSKMQGAGNDFVILDETKGLLGLSAHQYQYLADRHFGVGADQILSIRTPNDNAPKNVDFSYVIHNQDGTQAQHCGNGARCFVRYVIDRGLSQKSTIVVQTVNRILTLSELPDKTIQVDMGSPTLGEHEVGFDGEGLTAQRQKNLTLWQLPTPCDRPTPDKTNTPWVTLGMVSMGNPHAVQIVENIATANVAYLGDFISKHPRFKEGVNAGFMEIVDRGHVRLRVFERGAGETLACGSGACAAVVTGIALGLLDTTVNVQAMGGLLTVSWTGPGAIVTMSGPAQFVFDGEIELPIA